MNGGPPAIFFIVVGIPVLGGLALAAYSRMLQHRRLELLLAERKLLIEKGVTDLPPLEMPQPAAKPKKRDRLDNLKAGIMLLFISAAMLALDFSELGGIGPFPFGSRSESVGIPVILGAIGLALLLIHFIAGAYERREKREQEPRG